MATATVGNGIVGTDTVGSANAYSGNPALTGKGTLTSSATSQGGAAQSAGATLASEVWSGTSGPWPAQWTQIAVGGAAGYSATIQSSGGVTNPGTVGYAGIRESLTNVSAGNFDATITWTPTNQGESYFALVGSTDSSIGSANSFYPKNGYHLELGVGSSAAAGYAKLLRYGSDTGTTLVDNVTMTLRAGTSYRIRFKRDAAAVQFKVWQLGSAEPAAWSGTATDANPLTTNGNFYLANGNGAAATAMPATWDDLVITDGTNSNLKYTGTAALTGNGALLAYNGSSASRSAPLSGAGSLAVGGGQKSFASVNLTGNGALSLSVNARFPASVALQGNGALTTGINAGQVLGAQPTFAGAGSLNTNNRSASATTFVGLFGDGALSYARSNQVVTDTATLSGYGGLGAYGRGSQIGVPAPGVLEVKNNRNITGYSVEENATPINAASTEGGVGTIQFGFRQRDDWLSLFEQDIELDDDFRGTTSGKISAIHAENGLLSITADNRLSTLVGDTQARPMDGTFEAVARYYLKLGQITDGIYFHSDVRNIPVTTQGWHGDAWLNLKQLCTVYDVEVSLVSNNVAFRPVRSLNVNPRKLVTLTEDLESADIARAVEVTYYQNEWNDSELVYPRTPDEVLAATVYQVEANSVVEDDIELTVSLESIMQPVCVVDVAQDYDGNNSVYSVRAVDNSQVTPQQWNSTGGKIELSINEDTTSVHIKITGPTDQYYGPYRICGRVREVEDVTQIILPPGSPSPNADADAAAAEAAKKAAQDAIDKKKSKGTAKRKTKPESAAAKAARLKKEAQEKAKKQAQAEYDANKAFQDPAQSEEDYPSLRLVGTGTFIDKETLTLPTGVPAWRTAADIGVTVENTYVTSLEDAYNVGTTVAAQYRGEAHTMTATLAQINQRMGSGTIAYRTLGDIEDQYRGMTIGQFDDVWRGKKISDFNDAQAALVVDNFDNQVFGNVPGTRFLRGSAMFRITDSTTTESDIQITAVRDTMLGDFAVAHANQTVADFNNMYKGKTLKEFSRIPLLLKDS